MGPHEPPPASATPRRNTPSAVVLAAASEGVPETQRASGAALAMLVCKWCGQLPLAPHASACTPLAQSSVARRPRHGTKPVNQKTNKQPLELAVRHSERLPAPAYRAAGDR